MAIIETLRLQDIALCRRIMVWTILVFGCIEVACGISGKPTGLTIGSTTAVVDTSFVKVGATKETLTCTASGNKDTATEYKFLQNGQQVRAYEADGTTYDVTTPNQADHTKLGAYTCIARNGNEEADDASDPIFFTLDCSGGAGTCTTPDKHSECSNDYCKCGTHGGVFPKCNGCATDVDCSGPTPRCDDTASPKTCKACNATTCDAASAQPFCDIAGGSPGACLDCVVGTNAGCTDLTKPWCKKAGEACKACEVNPNNGPDNGCNPTSAKPFCVEVSGCAACTTASDKDAFCKRVNSLRPKCQDSGECTDGSTPAGTTGGTTKDGAATDSGTTAGKDDTNTSSAGTVTSTACLVIASVVVALMN